MCVLCFCVGCGKTSNVCINVYIGYSSPPHRYANVGSDGDKCINITSPVEQKTSESFTASFRYRFVFFYVLAHVLERERESVCIYLVARCRVYRMCGVYLLRCTSIQILRVPQRGNRERQKFIWKTMMTTTMAHSLWVFFKIAHSRRTVHTERYELSFQRTTRVVLQVVTARYCEIEAHLVHIPWIRCMRQFNEFHLFTFQRPRHGPWEVGSRRTAQTHKQGQILLCSILTHRAVMCALAFLFNDDPSMMDRDESIFVVNDTDGIHQWQTQFQHTALRRQHLWPSIIK